MGSGPIVRHLGVTTVIVTGVTLSMLNLSFSLGKIVMHLGVTNCYWGNLISGSMLNQSFSSGAKVMHLGPWGNLIGAKLIVQWRSLINHSVLVLNRSLNSHAKLQRRYLPPSIVRSLDRGFGNVRSGQLRRCVTELRIHMKLLFFPNRPVALQWYLSDYDVTVAVMWPLSHRECQIL